MRYNLENVLMADDPDGIVAELEMEQARKADPAMGLFEMARRYAQQAVDVEDEKEADALKLQSMMLTERCVAIIQQRQQLAQLPEQAKVPQVEEPEGGTQTLIPLLGGGGIGGGQPKREAEL